MSAQENVESFSEDIVDMAIKDIKIILPWFIYNTAKSFSYDTPNIIISTNFERVKDKITMLLHNLGLDYSISCKSFAYKVASNQKKRVTFVSNINANYVFHLNSLKEDINIIRQNKDNIEVKNIRTLINVYSKAQSLKFCKDKIPSIDVGIYGVALFTEGCNLLESISFYKELANSERNETSDKILERLKLLNPTSTMFSHQNNRQSSQKIIAKKSKKVPTWVWLIIISFSCCLLILAIDAYLANRLNLF